jgi:pyruvate kinase
MTMNRLSHHDVVNQVRKLYLKVSKQAAALLHPNYSTTQHRYSAHNLLAFLSYKNNVTSELITALRLRGLQLGSIQHMIHSLQIICSILGILSPVHVDYTEDPQTIIRKRAANLFGDNPNKGSPHIMLTLDAKMISSPILEQFLTHGMTVARINCAYDDESTWHKIIQSVRHAESQLRSKGQYGEQSCKIYMDLAGPKLRIGPMEKTVFPLKITVKKDEYGRPAESKKGIISSTTPATKISDDKYDFEISVFPEDGIRHLKEGDHLSFLDFRNKKRNFLITKIVPGGLVVNLDRTAYLDGHTKLLNAEHQVTLQVMNLESKTVRMQVKKADRLRIYLNQQYEGHYATEAGIASISVNLPQAFSRIQKGHSVYIDDGKVHGIVKDYNTEFVDVEIIAPNIPITLKENKGINLPDSDVGFSVPALTKKDEKDLAFICRHADIAGLSFVNHPNDLRAINQLLHSYGKPDFPIIAKIETKKAVHHFSSLLLEGLTFSRFGVMVARGDLAIEIGFHQLSVVQEEILSMCRAAHTPVILATQILDTLAKKGIPSRPEMADLSLGSEFDCLMLNKGPFMKQAVQFLKETLFLISEVKNYKQSVTRPLDFP